MCRRIQRNSINRSTSKLYFASRYYLLVAQIVCIDWINALLFRAFDRSMHRALMRQTCRHADMQTYYVLIIMFISLLEYAKQLAWWTHNGAYAISFHPKPFLRRTHTIEWTNSQNDQFPKLLQLIVIAMSIVRLCTVPTWSSGLASQLLHRFVFFFCAFLYANTCILMNELPAGPRDFHAFALWILQKFHMKYYYWII